MPAASTRAPDAEIDEAGEGIVGQAERRAAGIVDDQQDQPGADHRQDDPEEPRRGSSGFAAFAGHAGAPRLAPRPPLDRFQPGRQRPP